MTILHVVLYNHPSHNSPFFKMHFIIFDQMLTASGLYRHSLLFLFNKQKPSNLQKMQIWQTFLKPNNIA